MALIEVNAVGNTLGSSRYRQGDRPSRSSAGFTDVAEGHPLQNLGIPNPARWIRFWEDFVQGDHGLPLGASGITGNSEWAANVTEAGAGNCAVAYTDNIGGTLLITNDAADDDRCFFQKKGNPFLWSATQRLVFRARWKVSDVTESDIIMGLQVTDTTPLAVSDGIWFQKDDGDAFLDFHVASASTQTDSTAIATLVNDTFVVTTFVYDPLTAKFTLYVDDVAVASVVSTNASLVKITPSFGIQNGEAVAKTMTVDYILCAQERL